MIEFFSNRMIIAGFSGWFIAQVLKFFVDWWVEKGAHFERFVGSGGMPSSHSALVMAIAVSIGKYQGMDSAVFALALAFAAVAMYDAAGVRRETGVQAKLLNRMIEAWHMEGDLQFEKKLKEFVGHTPLEVFAGAILGGIIGFLV